MKLLIISHMPHYRSAGQIVGWGPTAQEIDHLAQLFDEIRHIACLHEEPAPASSLPYKANNISLIPVPPAGGDRLRSKLAIARVAPLYLRTIWRELAWADMVHVRCPANISLLALLLLRMTSQPRLRWFKYAGNWRPKGRESWSYTFQRWWLEKNLSSSEVTVNGQWPTQPPHVHSFLNPCLTAMDLQSGREAAAEKQLTLPLQLLYVGRLEESKGVGRAIHILQLLRQFGVEATLDLVGDGTERAAFEGLVRTLGLGGHVTFHGWLGRIELGPHFSRAHIMVFPANSSEGWPKVLSEGMAYGVVPLAGDVSSITQYLQHFQTGKTYAPHEVSKFVEGILWYVQHPERWKEESVNGVQSAGSFSYVNYQRAVRRLFDLKVVEPAEGHLDHETLSLSIY